MSTASRLSDRRLSPGIDLAHAALMPMLARWTLFASVLGNGIDIARVADRAEGVTLSFQVILRLVTTASATLCGIWGWWRLPQVRSALDTPRGWLTLATIVGTYVAVIGAPAPKVAFFVSHAILAYLLLTLTCLALFGLRRTLSDAMLALWCYVIASWLLRLAVPEWTVFNEYLSVDETLSRFGGLGHPNVLSAIGCLGLLLLLCNVRDGRTHVLWLLPALLLYCATMYETKSRTPLIAFGAVLLVISMPLYRYRVAYLVPVALGIAAIFAAGLVEITVGLDRAVDAVAVKLTKTGTVDELTSATGRTEIWHRAIELIKASPLSGYGGGSSSQVMLEHSGHAHNLFLETAVLFGIPTALLFASLVAVNVVDSFKTKIFFVREFTVYLLVLGLVESPLFGLVPDPSMCIWMACLFGPVIDRDSHG